MREELIRLPTGDFDRTYLKECFWDLKVTRFELKKFESGPALIDKSGGVSRPYVGQKFDPKFIDLVPAGWTHDHCEICYVRISAVEDDQAFNIGYFNGGTWVCKSCYELILSADNIEERLSELPKVTP